jgi:hypothetical protein
VFMLCVPERVEVVVFMLPACVALRSSFDFSSSLRRSSASFAILSAASCCLSLIERSDSVNSFCLFGSSI